MSHRSPPSSAPAPPQQRVLIYQSSRASDVTAEMGRLEAAFLKHHKRKAIIDLFVSDYGTPRKAAYGLTLYYTTEQRDEAQWFADQAADLSTTP